MLPVIALGFNFLSSFHQMRRGKANNFTSSLVHVSQREGHTIVSQVFVFALLLGKATWTPFIRGNGILYQVPTSRAPILTARGHQFENPSLSLAFLLLIWKVAFCISLLSMGRAFCLAVWIRGARTPNMSQTDSYRIFYTFLTLLSSPRFDFSPHPSVSRLQDGIAAALSSASQVFASFDSPLGESAEIVLRTPDVILFHNSPCQQLFAASKIL